MTISIAQRLWTGDVQPSIKKSDSRLKGGDNNYVTTSSTLSKYKSRFSKQKIRRWKKRILPTSPSATCFTYAIGEALSSRISFFVYCLLLFRNRIQRLFAEKGEIGEGIGFWIQEIPRKVARALDKLWISWAKPVRCYGAKAIGELLKKNSIFRTLELNNNLIDYSGTFMGMDALSTSFSKDSKLKTSSTWGPHTKPVSESDGVARMTRRRSRIPGWFTHQTMGDCLTIELPPDWCYENFKGIAFCLVFTPKTRNRRKSSYNSIGYRFKNFDGTPIDVDSPIPDSIFQYENIGIKSDQMLLGYHQSEPDWKKAKKSISVSFEVYGADCMVKKCGARLVCEEDEGEEEGSGSRMIQWLPPCSGVEDELTVNS
ncbi:hypothetical protein L2E82_31644 [Cichorium intybus]|uniref:Uncharacterized protein n=1 Tax=Cichorium intybus TaxID=13427 RepID=A0ACB9BFC3_CICIN|nr:hypothetical protein L2E82_31644 [Cichorium intybus]